MTRDEKKDLIRKMVEAATKHRVPLFFHNEKGIGLQDLIEEVLRAEGRKFEYLRYGEVPPPIVLKDGGVVRLKPKYAGTVLADFGEMETEDCAAVLSLAFDGHGLIVFEDGRDKFDRPRGSLALVSRALCIPVPD